MSYMEDPEDTYTFLFEISLRLAKNKKEADRLEFQNQNYNNTPYWIVRLLQVDLREWHKSSLYSKQHSLARKITCVYNMEANNPSMLC